MLIFKGCREKLSLGGQDAQQEQAAGNPTPRELGRTRQIRYPPRRCSGPVCTELQSQLAADSSNQRVRLKAECDRLEQEVALRGEEIRIKDVRMAQIDPKRRPHYPATERMAILELRATRGWSLEQAAKVFLVTADTISSWVRRIDEAGTEALVQTFQPVNKFPDYVRYLVQRLKVHCPSLGKQKIAQVLCRAGLHLGTTTVGRILKEDPHPKPAEKQAASPQAAGDASQAENVLVEATQRVVTAKRINHVWHVDLTLVPTGLGFWTSWLPFSLPQCWPFAYWVAVLIDHFSRRAMGTSPYSRRSLLPGMCGPSWDVPCIRPRQRPST